MNLRLTNIQTKLFFQNKYYYCQVGENGIVPSYKKKRVIKVHLKSNKFKVYLYKKR